MENAQYISFFNDPKNYINSIHEEWKKFIENGSTNGLSVRSEVVESWKLSFENGLSTDGTGAALVLDDKTMNKINRKCTMLLNAADSVIDEFVDVLKKRDASNCVINLCTEDTVILRTVSCGVEGEQYAKYQHILPGAILDEKHTGTTGVSLARMTNLPYALYGPEHFQQSARICSCAAAPITNVRNKQIKGIIALSGEGFEIVPDTIGMVTFIARTIEGNLLLNYIQNEEILVNHFKELLKGDIVDLIVAVDTDINIVASSSNMHHIVRSDLSVKRLERSIATIAKKVGEKYLLGLCKNDLNEVTESETEDYQIEFRPVYRNDVYIGMTLSIRDKKTGKQNGLEIGGLSAVPEIKLVGHDPKFREALKMAIGVASTDASVMLLGETGSGKEVFAKTIYENSNRSDEPYIAINCGAIPRELIGSELFGYSGGAFTGASQKGNAGKLEAANHGTIFLDEIGSMPLDAQSYLLRVIEENELYRLGSTKAIPIDVRIICATNEKLTDLIESKLFRLDLFYRLNVVEINIPPLRERKEDLAELVDHFCIYYSGEPCFMKDEDIEYIARYAWPGNIRELKNILHSAYVLRTNPVVALKSYVSIHLKPTEKLELVDSASNHRGESHDEIERVLEECDGNIAKAARQLGVARSTIYRRLERKPQ